MNNTLILVIKINEHDSERKAAELAELLREVATDHYNCTPLGFDVINERDISLSKKFKLED